MSDIPPYLLELVLRFPGANSDEERASMEADLVAWQHSENAIHDCAAILASGSDETLIRWSLLAIIRFLRRPSAEPAPHPEVAVPFFHLIAEGLLSNRYELTPPVFPNIICALVYCVLTEPALFPEVANLPADIHPLFLLEYATRAHDPSMGDPARAAYCTVDAAVVFESIIGFLSAEVQPEQATQWLLLYATAFRCYGGPLPYLPELFGTLVEVLGNFTPEMAAPLADFLEGVGAIGIDPFEQEEMDFGRALIEVSVQLCGRLLPDPSLIPKVSVLMGLIVDFGGGNFYILPGLEDLATVVFQAALETLAVFCEADHDEFFHLLDYTANSVGGGLSEPGGFNSIPVRLELLDRVGAVVEANPDFFYNARMEQIVEILSGANIGKKEPELMEYYIDRMAHGAPGICFLVAHATERVRSFHASHMSMTFFGQSVETVSFTAVDLFAECAQYIPDFAPIGVEIVFSIWESRGLSEKVAAALCALAKWYPALFWASGGTAIATVLNGLATSLGEWKGVVGPPVWTASAFFEALLVLLKYGELEDSVLGEKLQELGEALYEAVQAVGRAGDLDDVVCFLAPILLGDAKPSQNAVLRAFYAALYPTFAAMFDEYLGESNEKVVSELVEFFTSAMQGGWVDDRQRIAEWTVSVLSLPSPLPAISTLVELVLLLADLLPSEVLFDFFSRQDSGIYMEQIHAVLVARPDLVPNFPIEVLDNWSRQLVPDHLHKFAQDVTLRSAEQVLALAKLLAKSVNLNDQAAWVWFAGELKFLGDKYGMTQALFDFPWFEAVQV
jgi:hypothetical protein